MCVPLAVGAIIAGVASVAGTAVSVIGQANAAKAQQRAIDDQLAATKEENRKAASAEMFEQMRYARREQGRIRAAAGEAGLSLSSGSVEAMLMDSAMQAEMAGARSLSNMESRNRAGTAEADSMKSQIQKPTALSAGLQIGSAALSAWSGAQAAKIKAQPRTQQPSAA